MIQDFIGKPPAGPYLTELEAEILYLMAAGMTNAQIAKKRKRSYQTIKNQLHSIYSRFGVRSAIQLLNKLGELERRKQ